MQIGNDSKKCNITINEEKLEEATTFTCLGVIIKMAQLMKG